MDPLVDAVFVSSVNLGSTCIQVYEATTGTTIKSYRGTCLSSNSLCPVGGSDYILSGQKDKPLLQAWAINEHDPLAMRFPVPGRISSVAVSESESKYCALGIGEKIYIYHLNSGLSVSTISRHYQNVTCLKFTPCGCYLASAGDDGFVYLWSLSSLINSLHKSDRPQVQPHYVLGQHSDKVTGLCISGGGMRGILVTCSKDHSAKVFDLVTGRLRHNIIASCGLTAIDCNIIGSQIFLAGEKGTVLGLNLLPHIALEDIQLEGKGLTCHETAIHHMALSTYGDTLITGSADGEVKLWAITMSERKGVFSLPILAFQRTLHVGRGAITNILIMRVDREIFNTLKLKSSIKISPINNQNPVDILDATVPIPVRRKEVEPDKPIELITIAANLLLKQKKPLSKREKKFARKTVPESENNLSETDFLAYVQKLKQTNEDLYKFCLKHVLGDE